MTARVGICQPSIILGGRLRVILSIVEILNQAGIVPDIITARLSLEPEQITSQYGKNIRANFRLVTLPKPPKISGDFRILAFNALLRFFTSDYDLLINTSNSLIFLPRTQDVLTYMFFPRKRRIMVDEVSVHNPDVKLAPWSFRGVERKLLRLIYKVSAPHLRHKIICMTEFTRASLLQAYEIPPDMPIVYPPVHIADFQNNNQEREYAVTTVGRFSRDKRQLEQIKIASSLPEIPFHIVGFTGNKSYYQQCKRYLEENNIRHVKLYPDAPFEQMSCLLTTTRFFLHTLVNEPFGLTAVQAIAAGCLPIVHDSGGQRETVPIERLRYKDLQEVPAIINQLTALDSTSINSLVCDLQRHVKSNFDESTFYKKMEREIKPFLD